ncbi:hypothetical protein SDC9_209828 [bioreactor metagenome]|uniref:Uncharacterized protein n=1 Tax=bioreactor metagenome TaxID=1076179 RepID=A0A645JFV6_9ZZZZ
MSVPIIVLAVANAFVLLKNETINNTKDVLVSVDSKISPITFKSVLKSINAPPFATT